ARVGSFLQAVRQPATRPPRPTNKTAPGTTPPTPKADVQRKEVPAKAMATVTTVLLGVSPPVGMVTMNKTVCKQALNHKHQQTLTRLSTRPLGIGSRWGQCRGSPSGNAKSDATFN